MASFNDFESDEDLDFENSMTINDYSGDDNASEAIDHSMPDHLEHEPDLVRADLEDWLYGMELEDLLNQLHNDTSSATAADVFDVLRSRNWLENGALKGARLQGCSLAGVDLTDAVLVDADMDEVDLAKADLAGASLDEASLQDAVLRDASLTGASLERANLIGANLGGADLSMANLHEAQVDERQLRAASRLWGARLPDGSRYDGRFRLPGDLAAAREEGLDPDNERMMRDWYGSEADSGAA